jgi:hypothetical protein
MIPANGPGSLCVSALSPDSEDTRGSNRGVEAAQAAVTKRLAVCNPTVT